MWSFSNIGVAQPITLRCIVHQLGESDSKHLWVLSKMVENKKILLTVKQQFKLLEMFENGEPASE
jgi:hypothetical protein